MRCRTRSILISTLALALLCLQPHAAGQERSTPKGYLRGFLGYTTQALGDLNDAIEDDEQALRGLGIPLDWETFGGAMEFGAGADLRVSDTVTLGMQVGMQRSSVENSYSDWSGALSDHIDLRVIDVSGTLTFWPPNSPGLFVGGSMGVAFGTADSESRFRIYSEPEYDLDAESDFSGSGLSLGAFGGYQAAVGEAGLVFLKAGYRLRNLGEFDGDVCSPQSGCWDTEAQDNAGQALDFDFSGFFLECGLGFGVGR